MRQQLITIPLLNVLVQWIKDRLNEKSNTNHTHGAVTTTQNGFMTSADKTKLNGIAANATNTTVVNSLTSTSTTSALSANQGRLLNSSLSGKANAEHEHAEYLTELPTHTHEEYLTEADLPAPVDLSEYPTRFEVQTAVQSVADPVIVLTEAEFAAIVPDATKIYVIY